MDRDRPPRSPTPPKDSQETLTNRLGGAGVDDRREETKRDEAAKRKGLRNRTNRQRVQHTASAKSTSKEEEEKRRV